MNKSQRASLNRVRKIHGLGFWYRIRKGTKPDLDQLKDGQYVCSGGAGKRFHILMTEK